MPQLPAIDQNVCNTWTAVEKDFYNKSPFYFMKFATEYQKRHALFRRLITGRIPWKPNEGDTMKRVAQEWSPLIRQEAHPELLADVPTTDVNFTRERAFSVKLYRHRFKTREFWFLPEFEDFFKHMEHEFEDLQRQIVAYDELFIRTRIFHWAPNVYLCGQGLVVDAPMGIPNKTGTAAKSDAWIAQQIETGVGPLTMQEVYKMAIMAYNRIGMTPYSGSERAVANKGIDYSFALVVDDEQFLQFTNDPWTKENKALTLNIVTNTLEGRLFGKIQTEIEKYPLRYKYTNNTVTRENPEIVSESTYAEEKYRTRLNPAYTVDSQYAVGFLIGGRAHSIIDSGPPPAAFAKKSISGATGMNWNGKPYWTDKFLIDCADGNGAAQKELNETWGEHMRAQAQQTFAIAPDNAFNVLPFLYQRVLGINTTGTVT